MKFLMPPCPNKIMGGIVLAKKVLFILGCLILLTVPVLAAPAAPAID